jgi:hypothetical protein
MMPGGVYTTIDDIWGSSSDDIFFVAGGGLIWHYNGIEFSSMQSNTSNHLTGIWGSSNSSVFAVGSDGTILHYSPPANSPVLSVTPAFQNISDETAGTTAFEVANAGTGAMKWEAEENTSWLSISPSSGTDSGSITVNYNANPSGESRIGTIRVTAAGATNSPKYIEVRQGSDYSGSDKLRNAIQALKVLAGMNITDIADDTDANGNGKTELEDAVRNLRDALK